jgi:hypothetical protein
LLLLRSALDRRAARSGRRFFQILLPIVVQRGTQADVDEELLAGVTLVHAPDRRGVTVVPIARQVR